MTQSSRSMSLWNNPDSPSGITGFKDRLRTYPKRILFQTMMAQARCSIAS
ncbi:hypothetical protein [Providencia sp. PROV189]|nr:hypothetical protein [Providencia sp. PROV189]